MSALGDRVRRLTPGNVLIAVAAACWAITAIGVMNVTWMIVMAAVVAIEKLLPWNGAATGAIAVLIAALGLAVALVPGSVPALMTIPG